MPALTFYTWAKPKKAIAGITPMSAICPLETITPDAVAARVAADLQGRPVDQRSLLIWTPAGYGFDTHITKKTIKQFLLGTVDTSKTFNWYLQFYTGLKNRGVELAAAIMDEETNVTNWAFEQYGSKDKTLPSYLHTLYADTQVQAAMPVNLRQYTIDMVLGRHRPAVNAWNTWTIGIINSMLRNLVLNTYIQVFGKPLIVSNYANMRGAFPTYDYNGWPNYDQQVSDWSSPFCYIGLSGNRYNGNSTNKKDQYWNRFIDCVNYVRSATAFNAQCIPWVSYRSWLDPAKHSPTNLRWLWNQMMQHAVLTGVNKFLYWNPKDGNFSTDDDDNAIGEVVASVAAVTAPVQQLPEIPMDADEVVTGNLTTTYADFMSNKSQNLKLDILTDPAPVTAPNQQSPSSLQNPAPTDTTTTTTPAVDTPTDPVKTTPPSAWQSPRPTVPSWRMPTRNPNRLPFGPQTR